MASWRKADFRGSSIHVGKQMTLQTMAAQTTYHVYVQLACRCVPTFTCPSAVGTCCLAHSVRLPASSRAEGGVELEGIALPTITDMLTYESAWVTRGIRTTQGSVHQAVRRVRTFRHDRKGPKPIVGNK